MAFLVVNIVNMEGNDAVLNAVTDGKVQLKNHQVLHISRRSLQILLVVRPHGQCNLIPPNIRSLARLTIRGTSCQLTRVVLILKVFLEIILDVERIVNADEIVQGTKGGWNANLDIHVVIGSE